MSLTSYITFTHLHLILDLFFFLFHYSIVSLPFSFVSHIPQKQHERPPDDNSHHIQYPLLSSLRIFIVKWNVDETTMKRTNLPRFRPCRLAEQEIVDGL